jgi:hypothetical protein
VLGHVLEALGANQFLLAIGGDRLVAQSALGLSPGQEIALEVMKATAATIEMRVVPPTEGSSFDGGAFEPRLELAALVNAAKNAEGGRGATGGARALLGALETLLKSGEVPLTSRDLQALARVLTPQDTGGDGAALAVRLRAAFEQGGQLFEAHLRQAFESQPALSDEQALNRVRDDARMLLGRALHALSEQASQPGVAAARAQLEAAAAQMLAAQVQAGLHWVTDEALVLKLPVRLPSGDAEASLVVRRDPEDAESGAGGAARGFSVAFRITSDVLGPVAAHASWSGGALSATFSVDTVEARDLIQPELSAFADGLRNTFAHVHADLVIDPSRVHAPQVEDGLPELPGGSLLDVRV